jgi:preprotein translocase subunit SecF
MKLFDFIGKTRTWFTFSSVLLAIAIGALVWNGMVRGSALNFGVDFTGGTLLNLRFQNPVNTGQVRDILNNYNLGQSAIQKSGENDILIRTEPMEIDQRVKLVDELKMKFGEVELLEADTIGPVIGKELAQQAILALIAASLGIIIYVSFRFEFKYAAAALLALYHDAIITTGFVALFWINVETPFIAAILTIMGYSINDTIVIFDRIRENIKKYSNKKMKFAELINLSISETMARSINTVLTVIIAVLALLFFGGETLKDFALILLVGFIIGVYSSIFIASPLVAMWENKK